MRDINDGFPSGSHAHTEDYDYLSDSDLEDGSFSEGGEEEHQEDGNGGSQQEFKQAETTGTITPDGQLACPSSAGTTEVQRIGRSSYLPRQIYAIFANSNRSDGKCDSRMGKIAIIPDVAAVTCVWYDLIPTESCFSLVHYSFEALLYYLYTGEIKFAPLSSDPRHGASAEARIGDWGTRRPPSPSAKSIYRLADKVTSPGFDRFHHFSQDPV